MLVEDNEINTIVASKFMKKWDLEIDYAVDGIEALEKVKEVKYDLILMDLQMPKMDGYTASRAIRNLAGKRFKEVPIIALTASVLAEINRKVLKSGMNDFVSKPYNPAELYSKIAQYLLWR
ncbi:response regulator [Pedobacter sp. NJ-S-72]